MMKNSDYWKDRMNAISDELYEKSEKYYEDVKKQYDKAMRDIERDISVWYQRIADNNEISYAAAKKLLKRDELDEFKWSVEDYIKAGEENAVDQRWLKELENASAKYHISRLEAIKLQVQQRAELAAAQFDSSLGEHLGEAYKSVYYHTAFEIMQDVGVGHDLTRIDDRVLDTVLKKPWAHDGKVFSDRIWEDKERLVNNLHTELTQGLIRGDPPQRMIDRLSKRMGVSRSNAGRLIMTETAAISARATQDTYKELDVEEFQVLETLDSRTCEICRDMDGRHFPMSDYKIGLTVPPFHPRCRGTTIPYFDDEFTEGEMRAARDENDEGYVLVPGWLNYEQWKKVYIDSFVGKIDFANTVMVESTLRNYEDELVNSDVENAVVISPDGSVYKLTDNSAVNVDPMPLGNKLKGSYITHNHPAINTWYSFSWEDIGILLNCGVQQLSGVDHKYRYTMTRLPETKTEDTEIIQNLFEGEYRLRAIESSRNGEMNIDEDEYDFIVRLFAEKYGFEYERAEL